MKQKTLKPVRPSAAIEILYRKHLSKLIDQMHNSIMYWLKSAYKRLYPNIAQDASPPNELAAIIRRLVRRWRRHFNRLAEDLARYFAQHVSQRNDVALRRIMREGNFSVRFTKTPQMNNAVQAIVNENVSLIKSIPQQYLQRVEQLVMQSVSTGRRLDDLADSLQKEFQVTKRRAVLIARDQNNKATTALHRVRMLETGIKEAVWIHSTAGKQPRKTHLQAGRDKTRFDLEKGWFDPDPKVRKYILPGQLINCRCVMRPVVPGF